MNELSYEFMTAVAYDKGIVVNAYTGQCEETDFNSIGDILGEMGLSELNLDKVEVFEFKDDDFVKVGTYRMKKGNNK